MKMRHKSSRCMQLFHALCFSHISPDPLLLLLGWLHCWRLTFDVEILSDQVFERFYKLPEEKNAVEFYPILYSFHYIIHLLHPSAMVLVRNDRNKKTTQQRRNRTIHLLSPLTHSHQQLYKRHGKLLVRMTFPASPTAWFTGKSHAWYSQIQRDLFVAALAILLPNCSLRSTAELLARTLGQLHF